MRHAEVVVCVLPGMLSANTCLSVDCCPLGVIGGLKEAASSDSLEISGSLVISQETGFNIFSVELL